LSARLAVVTELQDFSKMRIQFDRFLLDTGRAQLFAAGTEVPLTPKAFGVLSLLVSRRPDVVDKDTIAAEVWGAPVSDASLTMVMTELRKALGDSAASPVFIRTAHRRGYAFAAQAADAAESSGVRETARFFLVTDGRRLALADGETIAGRDEACAISFDEPSVSRRHARFLVQDEVVTVEDLNSTNGTKVNGRKTSGAVRLQPGDTIKIGVVTAKFDAPQVTRSGRTVRLPGR
jgi:DNA-binding winged helix-turn-helix (wHTH) protein